jgi:hypothetical protein
MSTGVVHDVLFGRRARLPLSWLKILLIVAWCDHIIFRHVVSHDCQFSSACSPCLGSLLQTAVCLRRFRPMAISFCPLARNVLAHFWSRTASLALKQIIIYRTSRCYQIYMILFYSASRQPFFPLARNVLAPFWSRTASLALKIIIIYRTSRCYPIYMILFYSASRQYSVFFPLMVPSSLPHGDIEFSSAAVAIDWCFLPSRRYHTTDESDKNETPSLSSSSPVEILPASRCCPSTGIHPWILDLCPVCLQAGACLFLHHSWLFAPFDCCLSRWRHSLPSR